MLSYSYGVSWRDTAKKCFSVKHLAQGLLGLLLMVDLYVIQPPPLVIRLLLATLLVSACFVPYLRRFVVPALPILTWLITFYACQFIPLTWRPNHIFVNILPTLERILYGASLSEIISRHTHPVLDILAWLPYGVIHFALPFVFSLALFVFGPPGSLPVFGQAFGYMNLLGVLTQLLFPNASPWYEMSYGSSPADYSVPGEPGGLARIDKILGLSLYGSTFGSSPLVFGAFPSLHSGCASIEMAFFTYLCPRCWPLAVAYTMWMWWSTMYLTHHYLIDLVGGSIYALLAYFAARSYLPPLNRTARTRLDYLYTKGPVSIAAFWRSIEPERHLRISKEDEESMLNPETEDDTSYALVETAHKLTVWSERSTNMHRTDSDNLSTASGYSSSCSEPSSPLTPRSHASPSPSVTHGWKA